MTVIEIATVILMMLLLLIARAIFQPGWETVEQEKRLLIYRLGKFHKIAGPGLVFRWRRLDTVQRTFIVRNEPTDCRIDGLFLYGIPVGLTLNFWVCFDPAGTAGKDRDKLMQLAFFEDSERYRQMQIQLRQSLVNALGTAQKRRKLTQDASIIDKILPVIPGTQHCNEVLSDVKNQLATELILLGVILDRSRPITITHLHLTDDVVQSFERDRIVENLYRRFPGLPQDLILGMYAATKELERPIEIKKFEVEGNASAELEQRMMNGDDMTRLRFGSGGQGSAPSKPSGQPKNGEDPAHAPVGLHKNDLSVLKRVPRESSVQRKAA